MNCESDFINSEVGLDDIEWDNFGECTLIYESRLSRLYRAKKGGRYYILKTLRHISEPPAPEELYLLRREFAVSNGIVHPNIADIYSFESNSPVGPCIVMEYVDGCPLRKFLETCPAPGTRKKIFSQILDAVELIHSHGVVHNDIKPENILVTNRGNDIRLIDFGFSVDDMQYLTEHFGFTASYAAPELLSPDGKVDARSDIFSLGLVMRDIFGGKYSRIVRKCTFDVKEKRYRDIASLRKAWLHFYRPLHISIALLVSLLLFFFAAPPLVRVYSDYMENKRQMEMIAEHEQLLESLMSEACAYIDKEYDNTLREFGEWRCQDICFQIKCRFTVKVCRFRKEFCAQHFDDLNDRIVMEARIDAYESECSDRLMEKVNSFPKLEQLKTTLPEEEYTRLADKVQSFCITDFF